MQNVVIIGGTSGLGKAMAYEFHNRKHKVLIAGRNIEKINQEIKSITCDITNIQSIEYLENYSKNYFGDDKIDHWINSAAICEGPMKFIDLSMNDIQNVISTNLLGSLYGTKVAVNLNVKNIYNISGHGSNGFATSDFSLYGASKAGLQQFINTLKKENINIHTIAPGLMKTQLTNKMLNYNNYNKIIKFLLNFLAKDPEEVARIIVPKILKNKSYKNTKFCV
jgi:NAD(P)-dependent dehydrogenase (short-subunit alcohol dehydrogenase family)